MPGPPQYVFDPIGIVRSPFVERAAAPRQAVVAADVIGRIELYPGHGYEHALEGLEQWHRAWVVFVFHKNVEQGRGWRPKVTPPRSEQRQGVFATRSPHRPNPIGLSAVTVERVSDLVVHVRGIDILDGTPVLDLKPYVAYADAHPDGHAGWLAAADPVAPWQVTFSQHAQAQLEWLRLHDVDLAPAIRSTLALGPQPHAYRRIRKRCGSMTLAIKDWRVDFAIAGRTLSVDGLRTGYRARDLAANPALELHRAYVMQFSSSV